MTSEQKPRSIVVPAWQAAAPESARRNEQKRTRKSYPITDVLRAIRQMPETDAWRQLVLHRDKGTCVKCGSKQRVQVDHVIPLCAMVIEYRVATAKQAARTPGLFDTENGRVLCRACHRKATAAQRQVFWFPTSKVPHPSKATRVAPEQLELYLNGNLKHGGSRLRRRVAFRSVRWQQAQPILDWRTLSAAERLVQSVRLTPAHRIWAMHAGEVSGGACQRCGETGRLMRTIETVPLFDVLAALGITTALGAVARSDEVFVPERAMAVCKHCEPDGRHHIMMGNLPQAMRREVLAGARPLTLAAPAAEMPVLPVRSTPDPKALRDWAYRGSRTVAPPAILPPRSPTRFDLDLADEDEATTA